MVMPRVSTTGASPIAGWMCYLKNIWVKPEYAA